MSIAPPVIKDVWLYAGDFHVESSGHNRHRRATPAELKAHFDASEDRPGHWYEAQLLHYGLPPSKTKGTAKMRLFEAVNRGNLAVPAHILKVETELKKEWTKKEREAKQALKKSTESAAVAPTKGPSKRKADNAFQLNSNTPNVNINLSVSVGPQGNVIIAPAGPAAKKAKTTKSEAPTQKAARPKAEKAKTTEKPKATEKSKAAEKAKALAKLKATAEPASSVEKPPAAASGKKKSTTTKEAAAKPKSASLKPSGSKEAPAPKPTPSSGTAETATKGRTKQTARRGEYSGGSGTLRAVPPAEPSPPPRKIQTARLHLDRGGAPRKVARPKRNAEGDIVMNEDPPPPYPGSPRSWDNSSDGLRTASNTGSYDDDDDARSDSSLPPLGLLNGRYEITNFHDSGLILTLDGDALWGSFEIGPLSGILRLDKRPWSSSYRALDELEWRGEDDEGENYYRKNDGSFLRFLGGGDIEGEIEYNGRLLEFRGHRAKGQGTRSEISARAMREEWDGRYGYD